MAAVKQLHGVPLDKKHTLAVNKLMDIERYGREGRIDEEYQPPVMEPFKEKEHLRSWMGDPNARDQFALYRNDKVGVFWNNKSNPPENVVDRLNWTQLFVQWSPKGTFLASVHCDAPESLTRKPQLARLLATGAFGAAVFLTGRSRPGTGAQWVEL